MVEFKFGEFRNHKVEEKLFSTTPPPFTVENNRPVDFPTEVGVGGYANIKASVNVGKATDPRGTASPIKGAVLEHVPIQVVAAGEASTLNAIKKRCDYKPFAGLSPQFQAGHDALMGKIHEREVIVADDVLIQKYLATMDGPKRDRLTSVYVDQDFTLPGMHDKTVFAKAEALVKAPGGMPRVVYQGTDMYNLVMGSVAYELSARIAEELNRTNPLNTRDGIEVIYAVGLTGDQIGEIIHNTPGQCVENDFSNNDGTQPADVRKKEAMFYYKLGAPKWFVREFARTLSVRIFTRYGVKGEVKGQRWSGEVTTTTGNGYVNACINLAACYEAGIKRATLLVYGDDQLMFTVEERKAMPQALKTVSSSIGMISQPKVVESREQATFLRKRFVPSVNCTLPVPSFGRVLAKLPIRSNNNAAVKDDEYMAGKLLSAAYEHRHIYDIRTLLLEASASLSDKPFLDMRNQAMAYKYTADELRVMTSEAKVIESDYLDSFLRVVYGVNQNELYQCYLDAVDGILGYIRVNYGKKVRNKVSAPLAPKLPRALWNTALESLVTVDVAL